MNQHKYYKIWSCYCRNLIVRPRNATYIKYLNVLEKYMYYMFTIYSIYLPSTMKLQYWKLVMVQYL